MKNFLLGFLATIVVLPATLVGCLRLGIAEVRADVVEPGWQRELIHLTERASVRRRAPRVPNPLPHSESELIAGGKLYLDGCAGCHGRPGRLPRRRTSFLSPPEFAHVGTQYSEPELFWIVKHGLRRTGMSAYGLPGDYSERQLWLLAEFVKRMKDLPPSVQDAFQPKKP